MNQDLYEWRCMCGKRNTISDVICHKCTKQRWLQLNIDIDECIALQHRITPEHLHA